MNTINLSIFSLDLQGINSDLLKMELEKAEPYKDSYLQEGEAYKMNDCVYYLESDGKLHILARYNKYPCIETLAKRDALIAFFKPETSSIKFAKIEVMWLQWQKIPGFILAQHLSNKNRKQRCTA